MTPSQRIHQLERDNAKPCRKCDDRGYLLRPSPRRKPKPAYWFNRGPMGERPTPCDCGLIEKDDE